jgi:hypothetical protein
MPSPGRRWLSRAKRSVEAGRGRAAIEVGGVWVGKRRRLRKSKGPVGLGELRGEGYLGGRAKTA